MVYNGAFVISMLFQVFLVCCMEVTREGLRLYRVYKGSALLCLIGWCDQAEVFELLAVGCLEHKLLRDVALHFNLFLVLVRSKFLKALQFFVLTVGVRFLVRRVALERQ